MCNFFSARRHHEPFYVYHRRFQVLLLLCPAPPCMACFETPPPPVPSRPTTPLCYARSMLKYFRHPAQAKPRPGRRLHRGETRGVVSVVHVMCAQRTFSSLLDLHYIIAVTTPPMLCTVYAMYVCIICVCTRTSGVSSFHTKCM